MSSICKLIVPWPTRDFRDWTKKGPRVLSSPNSIGRNWRRGRDSNPRTACTVAGFQDRCFRPLSHPSGDGDRPAERPCRRALYGLGPSGGRS